MRVIDEDDLKNRQRIENLTFWGFLEAVVRVAQSKAIPTDEEVRASGYADGGEFLLRLRQDDPSAYRSFVERNDRKWYEETRQSIPKKLAVLLTLMMRTLAGNLERWQRDGSAAAVMRDAEAQDKAFKARGGEQYGHLTERRRREAAEQGRRRWSAASSAVLLSVSLGRISDGSAKGLERALDEQHAVFGRAATLIQAMYRGWVGRLEGKEGALARATAVLIQAHYRGHSARAALA